MSTHTHLYRFLLFYHTRGHTWYGRLLTVSLTAQTPNDGVLNLPNGLLAGDVDDAIDGVVPKFDGVEYLRSDCGANVCGLNGSEMSCCCCEWLFQFVPRTQW